MSPVNESRKLLLLIFLSCFLHTAVGSQGQVKIGVLVPYDGDYPWARQIAIPAVEVAIELINAGGILPGHQLVVHVADSKCSATYGPLAAMEMHYKDAVNVFIGPTCAYALAPVARYSPIWDVPVITAGGQWKAFADKAGEYKLLTRIFSPDASNFVLKFLQQTTDVVDNVTIIYEDDRLNEPSTCFPTAEALYVNFNKAEQPVFKAFHHLKVNLSVLSDVARLGSLLTRESTRSKVFILCGQGDFARQIMLSAADVGLNDNQYTFVNLDMYGSGPRMAKPWYRPYDSDEVNERAKTAYQRVITATQRTADGPGYQGFIDEVRRRAMRAYQNFRLDRDEMISNRFIGAFHDAVILYARALKDTLAAGYNITDGAEVNRRMWNRTFTGISGTIRLDDNGDRIGDYSLLSINRQTGENQVFAHYGGYKKEFVYLDGVGPEQRPRNEYDLV